MCLAALHAGPAVAADAEGNYAVWGVGQASCNQYANAYEQHAVQDYKSYLAGYLTAFNTVREGVYQATGSNTSTENLKLLYEHCRDHRMSSFELAVQALLEQTGAANRKAAEQKALTWGQPSAPRPIPLPQ